MKQLVFIGIFLLAAILAFASEEGLASWYGGKFQGRRTASGETFDTYQFTAAHPSLPFGTLVKVTNLENGKSTTVRINDRGPFVPGRIIDLSMVAASAIGLAGKGVAPVRIEPVAADTAAPDAQPTVPQAADPAAFSIQLGAFRSRENAEALLGRLADGGFKAEVEETETRLYRVVLRRVPADTLPQVQESLAASGWRDFLVRAEP